MFQSRFPGILELKILPCLRSSLSPDGGTGIQMCLLWQGFQWSIGFCIVFSFFFCDNLHLLQREVSKRFFISVSLHDSRKYHASCQGKEAILQSCPVVATGSTERGSKQRLHVGGNQLLSKWTLGPRDIREMVPPAGYFFSLPAGVRSEVTFPDLQNSLLHFKSYLYTTESVATLYQRHPCFFKPISYQLLGRVLRIWWVQKTFD